MEASTVNAGGATRQQLFKLRRIVSVQELIIQVFFSFYLASSEIDSADINECEPNHDGAESQPMCDGGTQSCLNTIGSYKCMCNRGYEKTGKFLLIDFRRAFSSK